MEAMGIIGFIFGLAGLSYATTAKNDIAKLKIEFEDFKASLEASDKSNKSSSSE
ncbi:hypothetical protein [Glaciecola sp. MF2-115]|uniref:hypothetical protein n=1 Tax=Glaciecola sp. MF2-115 TaxID=3384827 RepID=UPI0039A3E862